MKAVIHHRYGPAEEALSIEQIDKPVAKDNEVLVRVRAASMHADVWHVIEGIPYVLRLMGNGVRRPKLRVPGTDLAGVVESTGKNVTRFAAGDEVFGESAKFGWQNGGAYAEYAAVREDYLMRKPAAVTFEQAAAVPTAGFIALNNLLSSDKTGQSVLINGAGGSMGTLAIQIAKAQGARVTAVDRADKSSMMLSLGADRTLDHAKEDFLEVGERYDLIMDVVRMRRAKEYRHALTPTGRYVPIGHAHYGRAFHNLLQRIVGDLPYFVGLLLLTFLDARKRKEFKLRSKPELMAELQTLLESGRLTPVIGRTFPLEEVAKAMRCMQDEQVVGKIVITP